MRRVARGPDRRVPAREPGRVTEGAHLPENHYDQASRFAARLDAEAFLAWLLNLSEGGFEFRGWLDTRGVPFPGDPDRVSDTVAHVANTAKGGVPWIVAIEFQTKPDPEMFGRLLGYLSGLWLEKKPDVL